MPAGLSGLTQKTMNTSMYNGHLATYLRLLELRKTVSQIKEKDDRRNKYASDIKHAQQAEHQDHFKR